MKWYINDGTFITLKYDTKENMTEFMNLGV